MLQQRADDADETDTHLSDGCLPTGSVRCGADGDSPFMQYQATVHA